MYNKTIFWKRHFDQLSKLCEIWRLSADELEVPEFSSETDDVQVDLSVSAVADPGVLVYDPERHKSPRTRKKTNL